MSTECNGFDQCERIFLRIAQYYKSAIAGTIIAAGLMSGVWCWTWAEVKSYNTKQDERIEQIEAAFNDIAYLRSQSNEILDNQKVIIRYFERTKK